MRNYDESLRLLFNSTRLRNRETPFDNEQSEMDKLKPIDDFWKTKTIKPSDAYLERKNEQLKMINPHKVYNPFNEKDTVLKPISKL